jgi:hypothetical protein
MLILALSMTGICWRKKFRRAGGTTKMDEHEPMSAEVLSDLLKRSQYPPLDDLVIAGPVRDPAFEALYRQAVKVAEECGWDVPSRAEFEGQYRKEIAALNAQKD